MARQYLPSPSHPWRHSSVQRLRRLDLLTQEQTAEYLRVSARTVVNWARAGLLKRYPVSERYSRYKRAELDELLEFAKKENLPLTYHLIRRYQDARGVPDGRRTDPEEADQ